MLPCIVHGQSTKSEVKTVTVQDTEEEEIMEPPPPRLVSKFQTVDAWLTNICGNNQPKKAIAKYSVGLFESKDDYTLFIAGFNTYETDINHSSTRMDFEPKNMYFRLPKSYYNNLTRNQVLAKITSSLKKFTTTSTFKNSFLAEANLVVFDTNGTTLWTRE